MVIETSCGETADAPGTEWGDVSWETHTRGITLGEGEQLSYVDIGEGDGPAVLLVHGLGGSWRVWLENLLFLSTDHRVIAVDLPGFGGSSPPPGTGSFVAYARTLDRLCSSLGITSVVAVGNSFGGWISAELALRNPGLVAGLVLIDAAGIPTTRGERALVVPMLRLADRMAPLICRYRGALSHRPRIRRHAFGFVFTRADLISDDLVYQVLPASPSPIFRLVLETAIRSWSVAWCDRLADLESPALIVWGELDRQLPLRHAEEWMRLLRRSTLVVVADAGHMPMLERPDVVNEHIREFLIGVSGGAHDDADKKSGAAESGVIPAA